VLTSSLAAGKSTSTPLEGALQFRMGRKKIQISRIGDERNRQVGRLYHIAAEFLKTENTESKLKFDFSTIIS